MHIPRDLSLPETKEGFYIDTSGSIFYLFKEGSWWSFQYYDAKKPTRVTGTMLSFEAERIKSPKREVKRLGKQIRFIESKPAELSKSSS